MAAPSPLATTPTGPDPAEVARLERRARFIDKLSNMFGTHFTLLCAYLGIPSSALPDGVAQGKKAVKVIEYLETAGGDPDFQRLEAEIAKRGY